VGLDLAQQHMAVHGLHLHVADHQSDLLPRQHLQRCRTVLRRQRLVSGQRQRVAQGLAQVVVVFHNQDGQCL
jgi:hypothetical protein